MAAENPVVVITRRLPTTNPKIVIDYPMVTGMANQAAQQRMNTQILNLVNTLMRSQIQQLLSQGYQQINISVTGYYELKTNERGVLSLNIGNYTIATPAAHGLTIIKSLTFDIATGKAYSLSEQFKPGSDYRTVLNSIIREQIKERGVPLVNDFTGIKPDQDYYIADKCLVIYFQLYDLYAYAFGFPMYPISVYEIQDIIAENSPLGKMNTND